MNSVKVQFHPTFLTVSFDGTIFGFISLRVGIQRPSNMEVSDKKVLINNQHVGRGGDRSIIGIGMVDWHYIFHVECMGRRIAIGRE